MASRTLQCRDINTTDQYHTLHYTEWRTSRSNLLAQPLKVLIAVHGLTRNGRDFDYFAKHMIEAGNYVVICPDMPGRGKSQWLSDPSKYSYPQYVSDITTLIKHAGAQFGDQVVPVDYLGTSMGGLIGLLIASNDPSCALIRRMVINDIGPAVSKGALARLAEYVGKEGLFDSMNEVESYLRKIYAPFGALSDRQWRHLAEHSAVAVESNDSSTPSRYRIHYDPAIASVFPKPPASIPDIDLWPFWDKIRCRVMVIHGAESDILTASTLQQMKERGPGIARVLEIAGVGHAPALMDNEQLVAIGEFFTEQ